MSEELKKIDHLFESYNYKVSSDSTERVRVYTLQYGMYHAAEIISFDTETDVSKFKSDYSSLGYATEVKVIHNIEEVEEYLFEGFFIKTPLGFELKNRYKNFKKKQLKNLPEGSAYQYIDSDFEYLLQNNLGEITDIQSFSSKDKGIIDKINDLFDETEGALFIIIEAPAGFGKTCTANEILNKITLEKTKKLPFFTELSRNREARVFKHILLNEIDEQFPNGIKQNVVLEQIFKGRIPLIIDGFDELISKESYKEDVESMLATIVDLLKKDAKIIITTRKTAVLNSDLFIDTIAAVNDKFSLARFEIKEPTIENWLSPDRMKVIENNNFPINQISNPVLLAYLRNISFEKLQNYLSSEESSLIEKYFSYLLEREQTRQNLKLDNQTQFRIFRKLNRFMAEFDFTAENKEVIKDFIKEYNLEILQNSLKEYKSDEKPSIEELSETLSNHVFLDRKTDGNIGFINDFVFGYLIAENIVLKKFSEHYGEHFVNMVPQDFGQKAIESYKIQNVENKQKLWEEFTSNPFPYDKEFFFDVDYYLKKQITTNYTDLFISDRIISNIEFTSYIFERCVFSGVTFEDCIFESVLFKNSSFQNCKFFDCEILGTNKIFYNDFALYACTDNNDFITIVSELYNKDSFEEKTGINELTEIEVLQQFLQIDIKRPKPRKFSAIKLRLNDYSDREISNVIDRLIKKGYLHFKDDVGFITREAMNFLNHGN